MFAYMQKIDYFYIMKLNKHIMEFDYDVQPDDQIRDDDSFSDWWVNY